MHGEDGDKCRRNPPGGMRLVTAVAPGKPVMTQSRAEGEREQDAHGYDDHQPDGPDGGGREPADQPDCQSGGQPSAELDLDV